MLFGYPCNLQMYLSIIFFCCPQGAVDLIIDLPRFKDSHIIINKTDQILEELNIQGCRMLQL